MSKPTDEQIFLASFLGFLKDDDRPEGSIADLIIDRNDKWFTLKVNVKFNRHGTFNMPSLDIAKAELMELIENNSPIAQG
jgi:hypothetical protein